MRISIIAVIRHLILPDAYKRKKLEGQNFTGINLEKNGTQLKFINDLNLISEMGNSQFKEISQNPCFYMNTDISLDDFERFNYEFGGFTREFFYALWLVKDNAVTSNFTVSKLQSGQGFLNRTSLVNSYADGSYRNETFSMDELNEANEWFTLLLENNIVHSDKNSFEEQHQRNHDGLVINTDKYLPYLETKRFHRAMRFISVARKETLLPSRITFYIFALEALLSSSNNEVTMQVADRSARILGNTLEDRKRINKTIKTAYSLRSNYIHGSIFKPKTLKDTLKPFQSVEELSIEVDNIVRSIIKRFLTDLNHVIEMDNDNFVIWINELLYDY